MSRLSSKDSAGEGFLLYEREVQTEAQESYSHAAKVILNSSGVQKGSSVSADFDPEYQHLTVHTVRIRRGTNFISELDPSRFKVIQRERDLDRHMYDGSLSAVIFLEDVRVGDIIEYEYTIRGFNPIHKGKFARIYNLQWGVPVATQRYRILYPAGRTLYVRQRNGAPAPRASETKNFKELLWDIGDMPPMVWEGSVPSWFDSTPAIEISEFKTWHDVAVWAADLYSKPRSVPNELNETIAGWKKTSKTPEELAAHALQFVQDEIRYLGIESGVHSHEPTDPQLVYSRRFGDCKDKALLLCTILESLGLRAHPVAVNDSWRKAIGNWQPTPLAFDHIVVQLICSNKTYWLDPTAHLQRGRLEDRFFRDFGFGLVFDSATTNLVQIPPFQTGTPHRAVFETFRFRNTNGLVEMTVKTIARGKEADDLRRQLADSSLAEMEKSYIDYYAAYYLSIQQAAPLLVKDDVVSNTIETTEQYKITNIWKTSSAHQTLSCSFDARTINDILQVPSRNSRNMPFRLSHPVHREHHARILLVEDWEVQAEATNITTKAFRFSMKVRPQRRVIDMDYEYQSLRDAIEPAEFPAYFEAISRVSELLEFPIEKPNESSSKNPNWALVLTGFGFTCMLTIGSVWVYRRPRTAPPVTGSATESELVGLQGWLAVLGCALVLKFFSSLKLLPQSADLCSSQTWHALTDPSSGRYHYLWAPTIVLQILAYVGLPLMSLVLLIFFFNKDRLFPRLCISYLICQAVLIALLYGLLHAIGTTEYPLKNVTQAFGACVLWGAYLAKSKRVRATFVR
ncbi:MAG: DUF3857 domain-containing protein [Limisphaerales bacterium]